ncbi:MAG TPA: DUF3489 domain-containing protein [Bryobacteraceae bacterium]|nr:DUF3489 domain-containing protein [Bryobacteraceae bacterium]
MTAVITAKGENMIANTEQTETAPASTTAEPKATKKASAGARRAPVAPKKGKSGKKASPAKKGPKAQRGAKKNDSARDGSKAATILELLKRPGGATSKELQKAMGWQPHSLRVPVRDHPQEDGSGRHFTKAEDGERSYSVKS